jgi:hypothetical protein
MRFFRYFGRAFLKIYYEFAALIKINILWFLLTLPILTAPGAMAGLFYAINKLAKNESVNAHTFFEGFQKYFWVSWRLTLLNIAVFFIAYLNFVFYQDMQEIINKWPLGVVLGLVFVWTVLQIYILPLLIEQDSNHLLASIRSSIVLLLRYPGPTYMTASILFLLVLLSIWLFGVPLLIFLASMCAYLITTTLMYVLGKTKFVDSTVR